MDKDTIVVETEEVLVTDDNTGSKQAACLKCRGSKIKCVRIPDSELCKRCLQTGSECVVPSYHVGRYKGVKNKRSGLEKAIHQVEQALKKANSTGTGLATKHTQALERLAQRTKDVSVPDISSKVEHPIDRSVTSSPSAGEPRRLLHSFSDQSIQPVQRANSTDGHSNYSESPRNSARRHLSMMSNQPFVRRTNSLDERSSYSASPSMSDRRKSSYITSHPSIHSTGSLDERPAYPEKPGEVTINNADNPLQLLAMASGIPEDGSSANSPYGNNAISPAARTANSERTDSSRTDDFFSPMASKLDIATTLDPIDLGLVSIQESEQLFAFFHERLAHTRWGLDRSIHTASFVRLRSAFLFTSIMAAASLFVPGIGGLSLRLNNHNKYLMREISVQGYRSPEIVLAYMVSVPWLQPGANWARDDQTCWLLSNAMTIAMDLSMHKIVTPSSIMRPPGTMEKISPADIIQAQRALDLDSFAEIDAASEYGRRLVRCRERIWLALFTLDRGVCLARGRPWTVPIGPLVETCDTWHISDITDPWDGSLIASCVLRREYGTLVTSVRAACDQQAQAGDQTADVKRMREKIEGFFTTWYNTWSFQIQSSSGKIPPYVEILVSHGKLSAYCSVLNHPTASNETKQFFRAAGLTAALNVIRVAVENEAVLQSMPNNSVIMVSFAACFVLGLSTTRYEGQIYIAEHVRKSIEDVASVLERIGTITPHRKGASTLFGRHIRRIIRQHTSLMMEPMQERQVTVAQGAVPNRYNENSQHMSFALQPISADANSSYLGFDSISDDQLLAAIHNAKDATESFNMAMAPEDNLFMDWLDWPNPL